MTSQSRSIINTTDETFERDVLDRSQLELVVVDFWAEWCAPCRALGPILERLAEQAGGRFTLVKADTERCGGAAGAFGVSGIPAVYAVANRQVIEHFSGAMPEPALAQWLERAYSIFDLTQAQELIESDPQQAEQSLRAILEKTPDQAEALTTLAALFLDQDRIDECRELIEKLQERGFLEPAAENVLAALNLKSKPSLNLDEARAEAGSDPANADKQFALAEALIGRQSHAEAFDICLAMIEKDRRANGERGRKLMVEVFQALPPDSQLTNEYRRKLTMLLY